jgi:stage III sporulation protein AH
VAAAMLVLVGTAVFMNWKYAGLDVPAGVKMLGESTLVSGGEQGAGSAAAQSGEKLTAGTDTGSDAVTGAAGSAAGLNEDGVYTGSDYFASARLTRQQARDSAIALLEKAAGEDGAAKSVADEASQGIQALASYTMKEAQIENLVTAKGYADCVAFMNSDSISVVVSTDSGKLSDGDVAKIKDITVTETGYPASAVKIMAAN